MGMASSQVRLLMITNRIHDIEYKAQCLQNAKILLGFLEDDAWEEYQAALEGNDTITIGGKAAQNTNFSDLVNGLGVFMTDANNNVYASSTAKNAYIAAVGGEKASSNIDEDFKKFAWYMDNGTSAQIPEKRPAPAFKDMADTQRAVPDAIGYYVGAPQTVDKDTMTKEKGVYYEGTYEGNKIRCQANDTKLNGTTYTFSIDVFENGKKTGTENVSITMKKQVDGYEDKATGYVYYPNNEKNGLAEGQVRRDKSSNVLYTWTKGNSNSSPVEGGVGPIACDYSLVSGSTIGYTKARVEQAEIKSDNKQFFFNIEKNSVGNDETKIYYRRTKENQERDWNAGIKDSTLFSCEDGYTFYTKEEAEADWNKFNKPDNTHRQVFNAMSNAYATGKSVSAEDFTANDLADKVKNGGFKLQNTNGTSNAWYNSDNTGVNYDSSNPFTYSVETSRDETKIAQASAKYERECRKIDRKEKQYDTELAKLETERNALTTEMEGLKKVIEDNIERTFGIFS